MDHNKRVIQNIRDLLKGGFLHEAQAHAATALQESDTPEILTVCAQVQLKAEEWLHAARLYRQALQAKPDMRSAWLGLLRAEWGRGAINEAQAVLEELRAAGFDGDYLWELRLGQARGDRRQTVNGARLLLRNNEREKEALIAMRNACLHEEDLLTEALRNAEAHDRSSKETLMLRATQCEINSNLLGARAALEELNKSYPGDQDWRLALRSLIEQTEFRFEPSAPEKHSRTVQRMIELSPAEETWSRALVADDPASDVLVTHPGPSGVMALMFTGLADRFTFPLEVIDRYMAALGVQAIYLRDFGRLLHARGIRSLGDREQTRTALKRMIMEARPERLVVIGSSGGGFGGLRWAVELGAEKAIAFSAVTSIDPQVVERIHDTRTPLLHRRMLKEVPREEYNLAELIGGSPLQLHLFYGSGNRIDSGHAENLRGLPGVTLRPVDNVDQHAVLEPLIERGELLDELREIIFSNAN